MNAVADAQTDVSPAALVALILVLAGLDIAGAMMAKEWTTGRSHWLFVAGAGVFVLLFGVYAIGLRIAEMSTVTFGWIVGLQVAILVIEKLRYGTDLPTGKWVAIVGILCLQAYLVLSPTSAPEHDTTPALTPDAQAVAGELIAG